MFTHSSANDDTNADDTAAKNEPVDLSPSDNILQDIVEGDAAVLQDLPDPAPVVNPEPEPDTTVPAPPGDTPVPESSEQEENG
jgi:hypothetical protein